MAQGAKESHPIVPFGALDRHADFRANQNDVNTHSKAKITRKENRQEEEKVEKLKSDFRSRR